MSIEVNTKKLDLRKGIHGNYIKVILSWLILAAIFCPPFLRGLFFDSDLFVMETAVCIIYVVFWVYKILTNNKRFLETPVDYALFLLLLAYTVSMFFSINFRISLTEWMKYFMYFAVFHMLSELACTGRMKNYIGYVILISASFICILGFDGATGENISRMFNELFNITSIRVRFFDLFKWNRINSTFQYPNALAGYLIGCFYLCMGYLISSRKSFNKYILSSISYLILSTFIFTLSRGGYLVFVLSLLMLPVFLPKGSRMKSFTYILIPFIPNIITAFKLSYYLNHTQGNEVKIWITLAAGIALTLILTAAVNSISLLLQKINPRLFIIGSLVLIALLASAGIVIYNSNTSLVMDRTNEHEGGAKSVSRSMALAPGKEYKLVVEVESGSIDNGSNTYQIDILSKSQRDILAGNTQESMASYAGSATQGIEKKEIYFKVPENSMVVTVNFVSSQPGTRVVFARAYIINAWTEKVVKEIKLKNKYLPDEIESRLDNFAANRDVLQRIIYYKDALKILKDYWLLGAGGGAWQYLYFSYQSFFYLSRFTHNYLLQLGIETGIIGYIAFFILLYSVFATQLRYSRKNRNTTDSNNIFYTFILIAILGMILHSFIDFDFSLSSVYLLVWELLALYNSRMKLAYVRDKKEDSLKFASIKKVNIHPVAGIVIAGIIALIPLSFQIGQYQAKAASKVYNDYPDKAIKHLELAKKIDFSNPMYSVDYVNLLLKKDGFDQKDYNNALREVNYLYKKEKNNPYLLPIIGLYYVKLGDIQQALDVADLCVLKQRFADSQWESKVNIYYQAALSSFSSGKTDEGIGYLDKILLQINMAENVNKYNIKPFIFTPGTLEILETAKYIMDNKQRNITIDPSKIVFYLIPNIDINGDNLPDQWIKPENNQVTISIKDNNILTVNNKNKDQTYFIQSRNLNLQPGKIYSIELEGSTSNSSESIKYSVTGVGDGYLVFKDGIYEATFATPQEFNKGGNALKLGVDEKLDINKLLIIEK